MVTLNSILKEIKAVPLDRLEELYQVVHSLTPTSKEKKSSAKKILSFAGSFRTMSRKDYVEFQSYLRKSRSKSFDRKVDV